MTTQQKKPIYKSIKYWIIQILVIVVMFVGLTFIVDFMRTPNIQDKTINTNYTTLKNNTINLNNISTGKMSVVYFWGSWCGICKRVSPVINELNTDYPIVTVALKSGENTQVESYLSNKKLSFTTINDNSGSISDTWGVNAVPIIFLVKDGKVLYSMTGYQTPIGLRTKIWLFDKIF